MIKVFEIYRSKENGTYTVMFDNGMTISGINGSLAVVPLTDMEFENTQAIFDYMTHIQDKWGG